MTRWDDYFWPGTTVLRNIKGLTDQDQLNQYEYFRAAVREQEIRSGSVLIDRTFDASHLKALHKHLFQDVYEWAGRYRDVSMQKDRLPFADPSRFGTYLDDAAYIVSHVQWNEIERTDFVDKAAQVYAHINTAHPFREGNGRAAKLFMSQLAELTSYDFDFQAVEPAVWNQRSALSRPDRGAYTPAHRELIPVFRHITIDRPTTPPSSAINDAALRAARLANRDHPTDPRTAGTRSAGHGKVPTSYRPPGHYRADPGRDIER